MKRSEINQELRAAEEFFRSRQFQLPPFASWAMAQWHQESERCQEIFDCFLGWDITDFGRGDFRREGLLLFTLRNGIAGHPGYPKPYAEKIMIVREAQLTLMHCHENKTEDIINRGGGQLCFQLYRRRGASELDTTNPVELKQDGVMRQIAPGGVIVLHPGESITLEPGVFHAFWGAENSGDVLVGEVSAVNDDQSDNVYHQPQLRFPRIEENQAPYRLLVKDYETAIRRGKDLKS